eukprot:60811-Chlamydomonas_euryale.AAC.7
MSTTTTATIRTAESCRRCRTTCCHRLRSSASRSGLCCWTSLRVRGAVEGVIGVAKEAHERLEGCKHVAGICSNTIAGHGSSSACQQSCMTLPEPRLSLGHCFLPQETTHIYGANTKCSGKPGCVAFSGSVGCVLVGLNSCRDGCGRH